MSSKEAQDDTKRAKAAAKVNAVEGKLSSMTISTFPKNSKLQALMKKPAASVSAASATKCVIDKKKSPAIVDMTIEPRLKKLKPKTKVKTMESLEKVIVTKIPKKIKT